MLVAKRNLEDRITMLHAVRPTIRRRSIRLLLGPFLWPPLLMQPMAWSERTPEISAHDYTHNVDPFIGVDWGGNTFIGSAIPFGMVKLGPDMQTFDGRRSGFGYSSNGEILGFSHLHLS